MSDEAVVRGRAERVRVGTAEIFEVYVESDDAVLRELDADPAGMIRRFFESQGQVVNGVALNDNGDLPHLGGGHWAHDNSDQERSHWYPIYK
ncbi:hypothetical protein [Kitasatospora aureofaciens]|uniref:hypothetical protein n=1 Tax=Kitasatospora aureofaciens TaxID=1894 RepID=UPI001C4450F5|nr:hypothetical protein [Kitasatospora aureofaciens]MBV6699369.1 hypothetical protein [Kitasatospora aureofaciens]